MMRRDDILGGALITVLVGSLLSLGALAHYLKGEVLHDGETLCPSDRSVPHTVILVDRTDPFTDLHTMLFESAVERGSAALSAGERLSIFLIEARTSTPPTPILSLCKPDDGSNANWLYQNATLLRSAFEKRFAQPLTALVDGLREPAQAPASPILETIRAVSLLPSFREAPERRKLIVVSDLLENTARYSHYRTRPNFEEFRTSPYGASLMPSLKGVSVELVYLPNQRAQRRQGRAHLAFWHAYFTDAGATAVEVVSPLHHRASNVAFVGH